MLSIDLSPYRSIRPLTASFALLLALAPFASARDLPPRGGQVQVPNSSIEQQGDIGARAHTNIRVFVPSGGMDNIRPPTHNDVRNGVAPEQAPPYSGYYYLETPASLACVYKLVNQVSGCNPYATTAVPYGGSRAIAIVDAYDEPTAATDLADFSLQFGLPPATLQVVYASGKKPSSNSGWALEEALDIEWAHAMAPNAKIYLVEAASSSFSSLFAAVTVASNLVAAAGGGEVSMSWGSSEFSSEGSYDTYFTKPNVVYVASAGNSAGVIYPSASPNVVSAGGTTLSRNPSSGNFQQELSWQQTGGGPSAYEGLPAYQHNLSSTLGTKRGTPDIATVADPTTGVWVYRGGSWYIVGGTSVAAPVIAGIINLAGSFQVSTAAELAAIYNNSSGFTNIVNGDCGPYEGYLAGEGWNLCTGNGSPNGMNNK